MGERASWVGARFQKARINPLTGVGVQIETFTVEAVEAETWTGERRLVMRRDGDGHRFYPFLDTLRQAGWKAVENVVKFVRSDCDG